MDSYGIGEAPGLLYQLRADWNGANSSGHYKGQNIVILNKPASPVSNTKHKEQSSSREQNDQPTIMGKPVWRRAIALASRATKYCCNNAINNVTRACNLIIDNRCSLVYQGAFTVWLGGQLAFGQEDCLPIAVNNITYQFGKIVRLPYCGDYLYSMGSTSQSKFYNNSYRWHDKLPEHEVEVEPDEDLAEHEFICQEHRSVDVTVKMGKEEYPVKVLILKNDAINQNRFQFEVSHPLPEKLRRELALQVANLITENTRNIFRLETSKNKVCTDQASRPEAVFQLCNGASALPTEVTRTGDVHLMSCPDRQSATPLCNTTYTEPVYQLGFDLYEGDNLAYRAEGICNQKASVKVMLDGEVLSSSHFPGNASQCFFDNTVLPKTRAFVKGLSHVNQDDINDVCADFYGRDKVATNIDPCSHRVMPSSDVNALFPSAPKDSTDDFECDTEQPIPPSETADEPLNPQETTPDNSPSNNSNSTGLGIGMGVAGGVIITAGIVGFAMYGVKYAVNKCQSTGTNRDHTPDIECSLVSGYSDNTGDGKPSNCRKSTPAI